MDALLISDLHLSADQGALVERFLRFVDGEAKHAAQLYILGDLFDAWIGDDELDPREGSALAREVAAALRRLSESGTAIAFMHGNRDFLLGDRFAAAVGLRLLDEAVVVPLAGTPTLLMHGDTLCTDDTGYQKFRGEVRGAAWQTAFLSQSLGERRALIAALRAKSEAVKKANAMEIMDVNATAVAEAFRRHDVSVMVHGHTHRPGRHTLEVDGRACVRWVLPDWTAGSGGALRVRAGALEQIPV